jgi:hypothetical protein
VRISRTRRIQVDLGHYEKLEASCSVTMGHEDLGMTEEDLVAACAKKGGRREIEDELIAVVLECLNDQLEDEIREMSELSDNEKSVLAREVREHGERVSDGARRRRN